MMKTLRTYTLVKCPSCSLLQPAFYTDTTISCNRCEKPIPVTAPNLPKDEEEFEEWKAQLRAMIKKCKSCSFRVFQSDASILSCSLFSWDFDKCKADSFRRFQPFVMGAENDS